jgi:hypothetical protein
MNRILYMLVAVSIMSQAVPAAAQDANNLGNNPNDSSYPPSNAPIAPPNEADHVFGKSSSTHGLPSGTSYGTSSDPKKGLNSDTSNGGLSSDMKEGLPSDTGASSGSDTQKH